MLARSNTPVRSPKLPKVTEPWGATGWPMRAPAWSCCCPPTLPCGWFRCCRRSVDAGYLRLEVIAGPARCVQTARVLTHLAVPHRWHSQVVDAGGKVEACGSVSWSSRVDTWFAFLLSMIQLVMAVLRLNHFNFEVVKQLTGWWRSER